MNATMTRFGYPGTCIREHEHWAVLLRPKQVTLGSLVLAHKGNATEFSQIPATAFAELHVVINELEQRLKGAFEYDRINYLMLMMVDPEVHFHVFPRYQNSPSFDGVEFPDDGWPAPPQLASWTEISDETRAQLMQALS